MTDYKEYGIKCLRDESEALLDLIPLLDENFNKAVELIYNTKGRTIVTGVGKSGHIGAKIAATFASTGTPSFYVNPLDAYHGDLGMFTSEDVVIAVSYSGNTDELLRFIPILLKRNIPIIGISSNPNSLLGKYSICHLNVAVKREACPLNLAPTSSTTATLAMGDALACALMKARNFKKEDFAQFHPGGSLGRRLLSKVKDVMVADNLPKVKMETKVSDAIIEISAAKMGIAVVLDSQEKVCGVLSDGDVRRAMQNHKEEFFNLTVNDIYNTSPKIINEEENLTHAEDIIKCNRIHSLIVVNANNNFVGIIDAINCIVNN